MLVASLVEQPQDQGPKVRVPAPGAQGPGSGAQVEDSHAGPHAYIALL